VVAEAEGTGRLVPQAGELTDPIGDLGPDLLGGLPCRPALGGVVAGPEDLEDLVVVDPAAVDGAAEVVEHRLDARLELDDRPAQVVGHLMRDERVVQERELPVEQRVGGRLASRGAELGEQGRVGEQLPPGELGVGPASLGLG
jgi:hypothetical protein